MIASSSLVLQWGATIGSASGDAARMSRLRHSLSYAASTAALIVWTQAHLLTSSAHCSAGLPRPLVPSTMPTINVFSKESCRTTWPKDPIYVRPIHAAFFSFPNASADEVLYCFWISSVECRVIDTAEISDGSASDKETTVEIFKGNSHHARPKGLALAQSAGCFSGLHHMMFLGKGYEQ